MFTKIKTNLFLYATIFSLILILCSFSYAVKLKVNGQKKYTVGCDDSLVEFRATNTNLGFNHAIYIKSKKGELDFYSDSIKLVTYPERNSYIHSFAYDRNEFSGHQVIKKGKTVRLFFIITGNDFQDYKDVEKICILPTNFIMHDGKPLIKDTIVIDRKLFRDREK